MWNHAVKWAGQIDHAMDVSKRVFGALHPMIEDMGGGIGSNVNRAVMGTRLQRYDEAIRHDDAAGLPTAAGTTTKTSS